MQCHTCVDHAIFMKNKEGLEDAPGYLLDVRAR
jgi:hypothetical protein